jgi:glycosyltransferase involved in cell wall biosynthesis
MPLIDTEWNRGKCAFKAVEYMACGVPAVISPVGENNYLVQDGVNGFLADSTEEWASKIERLYNDPGLLSGIGKKAQETIKERYSYESVVPFIVSVLNKL